MWEKTFFLFFFHSPGGQAIFESVRRILCGVLGMALSCITAVLWYRILSVVESLEGSV
jgi:hypothetical protein